MGSRNVRAGLIGLGLLLAFATPNSVAPAQADDEAGVFPTPAEQYMVETVNRTRAEPDAEAARQGIDLNEGLEPGTLGSEPREPLAVNCPINLAAENHTKDLFANFTSLPGDHVGSDNRNPTQRVVDAGAVIIGGAAENNAWSGQGSSKVSAASVNALHKLLFRDFTSRFEVQGRGHRKVMLNGSRNEIGVGIGGGKFGSRTAAIVTYNLVTTNKLHITGVAIHDNVKNNDFFDIGEQLVGVTVVAIREGDGARLETATHRAGGYNLEVSPGTYDVTASGGGLPAPVTFDDVVVTDRNVKIDFITDNAIPAPPPTGFEVTKGLAKLGKDGNWGFKLNKAFLSFGIPSFEQADLDALEVRVDGVSYFTSADRAAGTVNEKLEPATGNVRKLTVKDLNKNKLLLDLKKGKFKVIIKSAPGFDPTDGDVVVIVPISGKQAAVTIPAAPKGDKGNKMTLGPATGSVDNVDD